MEQLLKSLFFFLPFMASVEAQIPDGLTAYRLPDQASPLTETLVTLGILALRQQNWQPLPYNPEKNTEPEPYNNPFLHISSDDSFIVTGPEPVPVHYSHEPKLSFPEYDLPDYRILLKKQQAEMERIHKIATEGMAMGRVKIKITEATTDRDSARRVYIASVLCLESTGKACWKVLSKIVSCANSESDSTRENTRAPSQEAAQSAPRKRKRNHSSEDESVATETDDLKPPLKKQKLQQTGSELERYDPQQLLNQYLKGFNAMPTPADNFCWLHAIHLSAGQNVSTLIRTLINMINYHLPGNEQAVATEHSAFLSSWITAQGEENVQLVSEQLSNNIWPDFTILLPLLSYLFKKTFVVINLQASGLTQDQVFTYATSNHVQVTIVSEASAINTPEEKIYLGLLAKDNHFVGIRPDTRDDNYSHHCPVCLNKFTQSSVIKSTSCFHYLCNECFEKLNTPHVSTCPVCWQQLSINLDINDWGCPVCRTQQKFIESRD
ncbi:zinc finger, RING-type domain-containing protein [Endozoicomonas sp. 4G]|uniref:RING finger protein n=1 Tax=Endozoicomonas sp. 4G TaxID=2872754 RepID=UPI00207868E5|nr:zinc finger, RING-type domain-containing protein [Endozoicomonas sp. 4G]